jgi:flagellar hook-basal body complex protein FliE
MSDLTISNYQSMLPKMAAPETQREKSSSSSFSNYAQRALADVNRQMRIADEAIKDLATGKNQDIHNTMIAMQKAEISFELVLQIRNKLIAAYDEIRRMSI